MARHGDATEPSTHQGAIGIQRTGPFLPPVTFPGIGHVVVTPAVRRAIEDQGLTGASFREVTNHYDLQPENEPPPDFFRTRSFKYLFVTERHRRPMALARARQRGELNR